MAELKSSKKDASVTEFLSSCNPAYREDCQQLLDLMERVSGCSAAMWGDTMVGFDSYRYLRKNGQQFTYFRIGFSPRKSALTIYVIIGYEAFPELMERLGKYKTGKSCLYVKKLSDVDLAVLEELLGAALVKMREQYPG